MRNDYSRHLEKAKSSHKHPSVNVRVDFEARNVEYRRLNPYATGDALAVSGEVNAMIAAAINANPRWFWHGPDA